MPNITDKDLMEREAALKALIEELLPDFVKSCHDNSDVVVIHQDSFALDYQADELLLLGKAIKFAGLHGKELRIIGRNRETLAVSTNPQLVQ
jgi:hypothetical protein